jgi:putative FmdB family regulatory protein
MPIHEYNCQSCEQTFEVLVIGKTVPEVHCPVCSSVGVDRLIGLPGSARAVDEKPPTNCSGDGPPCGAPWCGRKG